MSEFFLKDTEDDKKNPTVTHYLCVNMFIFEMWQNNWIYFVDGSSLVSSMYVYKHWFKKSIWFTEVHTHRDLHAVIALKFRDVLVSTGHLRTVQRPETTHHLDVTLGRVPHLSVSALDGWVDGRMGGWLNGRMGEWMKRPSYEWSSSSSSQ